MYTTVAFRSLAREWQERMAGNPEYSLVENDSFFRAGLSRAPVMESDYQALQEYLTRLTSQYEGMSLTDALPGREMEMPDGTCYCIETSVPVRVPDADPGRVMDVLGADIQLVKGIGRKKEEELRRKGCRGLSDLLSHRKFSGEAEQALRIISGGDPSRIADLLRRWHRVSDPRALLVSALHRREDIVFLDLETLGLFSRPVILFGIGQADGSALRIRQYLVREMDEEPACLSVMAKLLTGDRALVTYNGRAFDAPCLRERAAYYGSWWSPRSPHYDLLAPARRLYRGVSRDCRLSTLERDLFGIDRSPDLPGCMIPEWYAHYHATGNPGPLVAIAAHNRQDIESLARLFLHLREATS